MEDIVLFRQAALEYPLMRNMSQLYAWQVAEVNTNSGFWRIGTSLGRETYRPGNNRGVGRCDQGTGF